MKICIVGGTGNISTSIVKLLLKQGHEVVLFNRGQRRAPPDGVRAICGDRKDRRTFEEAMQAEQFDVAIDMICFDAEDAASAVRAFRSVKHHVHCSTVCTYGVQSDWLPVTEDHPLRPISDYGRNKVAADRTLMEAHFRDDFPVTILKPSTTFGPQWDLLRQVARGPAWVDRVRKGKPIAVCGDGRALHQWLYVDDAALAFAHILGREHCIGRTYNMTKNTFASWADYHRTAMKVIGNEAELVGIPLDTLVAAEVPGVALCRTIFSHNTVYSSARLMRDVPEFRPAVSLEEALRRVYDTMLHENRVPNLHEEDWEDRLIAAQREVAGRAAGSTS